MKITIPHRTTVAWVLVELWKMLSGPFAWAGRHPKCAVAVVLFLGLTAVFGLRTSTAVPFYAIPVLALWGLSHRPSFLKLVVYPAKADWRRWRRYERVWKDVMTLNRLSEVSRDGENIYPVIAKVRCHEHGDSVVVRWLISQELGDYAYRLEALADDFGARVCRVFREPVVRPWWMFWRPSSGMRVRLEFAYGPDPLAEPIPALPIPASSDDVDFSAVPVGRMETGELWTIDLAANLHILLGGQTGAGKSGVLQQLLRSLAPAIRDGRVVVWGIDPKEGMEFAGVQEMFARYEDGEVEDMAAMLGDAVTAMRKQMRKLTAQKIRKHVPTPEMPLVLVVVDEMIDLLNPKSKEKKVADSIAASMGHLLRKGRAAGFLVIGSVTDPRVEASGGVRNHFPVKIGMRLDTPDETGMVMGPGARALGALCDTIPVELPGVGYVRVRGGEILRVRAAFVRDEDIAAMVEEYAPKPKLATVS